MSAVVEQYPYGFRYRVSSGASLVACSPVFTELYDVITALQSRFPGMKVDKINVLA